MLCWSGKRRTRRRLWRPSERVNLSDALGALRDVLSLLRCRHYVTDASGMRGGRCSCYRCHQTVRSCHFTLCVKNTPCCGSASTTGASPTSRRTPSGSRMLVSVERKLLFYCSWSVSVLDTLALRSLRTDAIQYAAEEMSSTWRAGAREPSHRQGRDVLSTAVGASSAEVEPGASLASAAATSNKSGSTGVSVHEVS